MKYTMSEMFPAFYHVWQEECLCVHGAWEWIFSKILGLFILGLDFLVSTPMTSPFSAFSFVFWTFDNASWLAETSSTGHQHNIKLTRANRSSMKQIFL